MLTSAFGRLHLLTSTRIHHLKSPDCKASFENGHPNADVNKDSQPQIARSQGILRKWMSECRRQQTFTTSNCQIARHPSKMDVRVLLGRPSHGTVALEHSGTGAWCPPNHPSVDLFGPGLPACGLRCQACLHLALLGPTWGTPLQRPPKPPGNMFTHIS